MGDLKSQVHDWEPGIKRSGLFWTIPIDPSQIHIDLHRGRAHFRARHLRMPDFHDFLNAVSPSPHRRPGHVSFDVEWHADGQAQHIRDAAFGFGGRFRAGTARIHFHASNQGSDVVYSSLAHGQTTVSAGLGRERNGRFFD